ncbi:hypothetical protein C2I33_24375 [Ralstonia solanacearum]|nr:hypothetical protein C2I33_24375 [Ralstonia solanacearum]
MVACLREASHHVERPLTPSASRQPGRAALPSRPNVCAGRAPRPARRHSGAVTGPCRTGCPVRRSLRRPDRLPLRARPRHPDRGRGDRFRRDRKRSADPIPHFAASDNALKLRYDPHPGADRQRKSPRAGGRAGLTSLAFDDERWSGVLCE